MKSAAFTHNYQTFSPSEELKMFVKEYWLYDMKSRIGGRQTRELLQPNLFPEIIFKKGVDYENFDIKKNKVAVINSSTISGIQSHAKACRRINTEERLFLIGIKLEYTGLYQLLNMPLIEFCDNSIPKEFLANNFLNTLEDLLLPVSTSCEIIKILNSELTSYFYSKNVNNECLHFTRLINSIHLNSLTQLKDETQLSYKFLERKFKKYIGITPKKYFKLKRYLSFYESWLKHDHYNYIDLVYRYDFFDQNHLIKDFKSVLNQSPNQFKKTKQNKFSEYIIHYKLNLMDKYSSSLS